MIQAGTISTGSATNARVAGLYWMSSMRSLRNTTSPGVTAMSLPTSSPAAWLGLHGERAPEILLEVVRAAREIGAGLLKRAFDDHRIEPRHVRRRPHIEQLARDEGDSGGVFRRHAADFARGARPPGFLREEGLLPQSVRKPFPHIVVEAAVAALRFERWFRVLGQAMRGEAREAGADIHGLEPELDEPAGSVGKMRGPVEPGGIERVRRDALGESRRHGAAETVHGLE